MERTLRGVRVAILATDGFEPSELLEPRKALDDAGAQTYIVSPRAGRIRGWHERDWGEEIQVDLTIEEARDHDFDALMLPGGMMNPDRLRMTPSAVSFVRSFVDATKPIAAICHAPWMLIEAECVRGRRVASWPSLRTDLANAGATWVDEAVVHDGDLVTSRRPGDIPAFNREMIQRFREAVQRVKHAKT